jgi:CHAT domain-containing protein
MQNRIHFIIFFTLIACSGLAQCPERVFIYTKLEKIIADDDKQQQISALRNLANLCEKCNYNEDSTYARVFHVLGRSYWQIHELDSALYYTKKAISLNSSTSKSVKAANLCHSYYNLGAIYNEIGDLQLAANALDNAIRIGQKYPEKMASLAGSYLLKASIYTSLGDYENTITASGQSYNYAEKTHRNDLMAKSLREKSQGLIELNRLAEGETTLSQSLVLASDFDGIKASIYSMLAELNKKQNHKNEVVSFYEKSFLSFKKDEFDYGCAQSLTNLGYYYGNDLRIYSKALEKFFAALEYMPEKLGRAVILSNIGNIYRSLRDFPKSLQYHQTALVTAPLNFSKKRNEDNPNSSFFKAIIDKAAIFTIIQDKANTWLDYAKHTKNNKARLRNALKTYMLADTMIDYMRWEHTGNISKLFWRNKTRSMYENAIETCYLLGDAEKAFYFFEKSRAVMLNDQLNELGANQVLAAKDIANEKALRQQVSDLQNKLNEAEGGDKAATTIREKLFEAQEKQVAFIHNLEKTNPQYYAYKYDNSVLSFARLRREILPDNQTFLTYFVGESSVYGLHISLNKAILKKINLADFLTNSFELNRFIGSKALQNKSFDKYLSVSNNLYRQLILPFNIPLGTRIIVSPDGSFLPMQALSKSPSTPDFLVKYFAFSYTYSAGFLAKSTRKTVPFFPTKSFLGLAPLNFNARLAQTPLPGSDRTLRELGENFSFAKSLTGKEATRNAFVRDASNYRIVQLLTHATADSTGTIPTLYFSDSTLLLTELSPQNQSLTELLVLSACQTGVGKNQRGEGVFSLARGFAAIGIPSTITTLWSVENQPVYELTKLFYAGLKDNLPLDVALQQAQIQWLETASKTDQLPYSWAGIVMVGNADPIQTHSYVLSILLVLASIALLVGFIIFLKRRSPRR